MGASDLLTMSTIRVRTSTPSTLKEEREEGLRKIAEHLSKVNEIAESLSNVRLQAPISWELLNSLRRDVEERLQWVLNAK